MASSSRSSGHDGAEGSDETTTDFASFEQMLASVSFRELSSVTTVPPADPVATPIDGFWTTSFTYDELASSPLLYDRGEVNDENWGDFTFAFEQGRFTFAQENPVASYSSSGTFTVDGDTVALNLKGGVEHFAMRWSLERNTLTFERDEALGIAPTPYVLKSWSRQR